MNSKNIRIVHLISSPRYSGAETLVMSLLSRMLVQGYPCALVALSPCDPSFNGELDKIKQLGCEIFVPDKPLIRLQRVSWIRKSLHAFQADVVFAHSQIPSYYARAALFGNSTVSTVTVLHRDKGFKPIVHRIFEKATWFLSNAVIGCSAASIRYYREYVTKKQDARWIPNGINLSTYNSTGKDRPYIRKELYKADPEEIVLLQVGRIGKQKNQLSTVNAVSLFGSRNKDLRIKLIFVGIFEEQDYLKLVQDASDKTGGNVTIEFTGPRQDVPELLVGADVYLMPSNMEGFSIAALEALMSGIFCIFSSIESLAPFGKVPGVRILPEDYDADQFASIIEECVQTGSLDKKYIRDMNTYSIETCTESYLELAKELSNHNQG